MHAIHQNNQFFLYKDIKWQVKLHQKQRRIRMLSFKKFRIQTTEKSLMLMISIPFAQATASCVYPT